MQEVLLRAGETNEGDGKSHGPETVTCRPAAPFMIVAVSYENIAYVLWEHNLMRITVRGLVGY